jgi:hypothetical protein
MRTLAISALVSALALVLIPSGALAQYPRGVIAEDCTATWCGWCPFAYTGLEVMKSRYDTTEFTSVRYYSSSDGGGLATAETDGRITYYGVDGYPTVIFDGIYPVVGGSAEIATGSSYDPIVSSEIGRPSPVKITIHSIDLVQPSGSIDLDVEVMETIPDISTIKIRVLILENNVTYDGHLYTDVTRDILPNPSLTVSQTGQVQNVVQSFTINASWKTADLWAAVFVQNNAGKEILQSASTRPAPAYALRYWAKSGRVVVRPSHSGTYEFPEFAVYNLGTNPDVIRVTLQPGTLPNGWSCAFTDGLTDYADHVDLSLDPGEYQTFWMKVAVGDAGYMLPKIVLTSVNQPGKSREIPYGVTTSDVRVLIVDDDGTQTYESLYADALTAAGLTYGLWPTSYGQVTAADLANFDAVIWEIGLQYPTLTGTDRAAVSGYLDGGGKLFITGQELGWEMDDEGGEALTWYNTYMHVNFVQDDTNRNGLNGVTGDPISDGMTLALASSLNPYPDAISPRDASATTIFTYTGTVYSGGVRVDTGVYRLVYLGFGYEAITTQQNRELLLARAMEWLGLTSASAPEELSPSLLWVRACPNPAPGRTTLSYNLPQAGRVTFEIYGPDGGVVRTLARNQEQAGPHVAVWDGRDARGVQCPAGIYFYRLETPQAAPAGKLILMR